MPTVLSVDDPEALDHAVAALLAGQAIVLPTDTIYGLAVAAEAVGATAAVFAIKGRPDSVPLAVLVDSFDQALTLCEPPPPAARHLAARWWPGPLTLVLTRRAGSTVELGGDGSTVGVRCPDHPFVRALALSVGPLATTSANRHGEPTPVVAADVAAALGERVALVIDGGALSGIASTVVDATDPALPVLRAGPISREQIDAAALP